jgi:flagellar basal-body rod modification protein FlgD
MSSSGVSGVKGQTGQQVPDTVANGDAFENMDLQQFVTLLVTELQNQDPTEPMKNSEILQQISQMKAIASNDKMSDTLTSMQLQQNMLSGSALLGKTIKGLNDQGTSVSGVVDKVSVGGDTVTLKIGSESVKLKNVSEIDPTT